jgi:hypothetical protein
MNTARRNVFLLACCQALLTNGVTLIAIGALASYELMAQRRAAMPS